MSHDKREKMRYELSQHYDLLLSTMIDLFLQCCISCQLRKPVEESCSINSYHSSWVYDKTTNGTYRSLHLSWQGFPKDTTLPRSLS